jgi:membrane-bound metal-dependent hydrolase YbcI (DUF457 family)
LEPFTHAFTSLALAHAGERRLPRFGASMMIVAGLAPDLDYASYFAGPGAFLRFHRTLLHSVAGAAVTACVVGAGFCLLDRMRPVKKPSGAAPARPLPFAAAFAICAVGSAGHVLLDLFSGAGVQLLWPFRARWFGWELVTNLDPWVLLILVAGLLLPLLFRLVNEEVGDRRKTRGSSRAAIVTLILIAAYFGVRADLRDRAIDLLLAREYHGRIPLSAGAFPTAWQPFDWRGVVVTDDTIEEVEVPLGAAGAEFDSNRSLTHYKPQDSPALETGQMTPEARRFLVYARFPFASVQRIEDDYRVEVHDLRFEQDDTSAANIFVRVDLSSDLRIRRAGFRFAASPNP